VYSFVFRVDSGNVPELGTGHLYRCIKIYNYLKKKKVNKNKILFVIKTKGNYKTSKKILKQFDIKYVSINSNIRDATLEENLFLKKFPAKVIIFDRLTRVNNDFLKRIKKSFRKVVGIDLLVDKNAKIDLHIDPLNNNFNNTKKLQNFKYNILPSIYEKKKILNKKKHKKIFTFFGGYDFKKIKKKVLNLKVANTKFLFPSTKKIFYEQMQNSDLVLCSGGLTVFDAIYLNKIVIAVPQYEHQLKNLKVLKKNEVISICKINSYFKNNLLKLIEKSLNFTYSQKLAIKTKQKKIISKKSQIQTLEKIYELYV
tara:strand:+ start:5541 stop:6476 length:936 start_codon:yes stop_codon:yes gene_type:complete